MEALNPQVHYGIFASMIVVVIVAVLTGIMHYINSRRNRLPGPQGLPVLGNALQIPSEHLATYFRTLLETYGGLVSLNLAGVPVILIGEMKIAKDILEKRSSKFSSRPIAPFMRYVDPIQSYWALRGQTDGYHIARKLTAGLMSSARAGLTEPLQQFESLINVRHLLEDDGQDWYRQINRMSASTVLTAAFGAHFPTGDEPELDEAMSSINELIKLCTPFASIINVLPFLDWIPGPMPWRIRARVHRKREDAFYEKLVHDALYGKASGMNTWAAVFASEDKPEGDQRHFLNQFAAAAIEAITTSLQIFVLACLLYPDWIRKAQKELDDVVGPECLPTFAERSHLPYIEAVVRETLRWRPAARFGLPHRSTADDVIEYNGQQYFIPKGTTVFAVTWAIEHDQTRYAHPGLFNPERFLDDMGQLKLGYETSAFGFGRRVCPGAPFAERSLWINIAMLLWTFDILKSQEPDPQTGLLFHYDDSDAAFHGDLSNAPHKFPAVFRPRSDRHAEVARRTWDMCEKDLNAILPASK